MAFTVNFYNFAKKRNSTAQPAGAGAYYTCILKEASSVVEPTIIIRYDPSTPAGPLNYNYCYIAEFGRYYFVTDIQYIDRQWHIGLECDALATYRGEIGSTTAYIERAASAQNLAVSDSLYPALAEISRVETEVSGDVYPADYKTGRYVVGIINASEATVGAVSYYLFTNAQFAALRHQLMDDISWMDLDITEIGEGLSKALINPFKYVVSCQWFPFTTDFGTAVTSINYGWWTFALEARLLPQKPILTASYAINLQHHPQSERGQYLDVQPYTRRTLYFPPFGSIPIDGSKIVGDDVLACQIKVDYMTGDGILTVTSASADYTQSATIYRGTAKIGVEIQLAQMAVDYANLATGAITSVGSMIGSFATGNIGAGLATAASTANNIAHAMYPELASSGTNGSTALYDLAPKLVTFYTYVADENVADFGRPVCQRLQIGTLSGYVKCSGASVVMAGTTDEKDAVNTYLNGGFYYA